jgi:hypothetical protein
LSNLRSSSNKNIISLKKQFSEQTEINVNKLRNDYTNNNFFLKDLELKNFIRTKIKKLTAGSDGKERKTKSKTDLVRVKVNSKNSSSALSNKMSELFSPLSNLKSNSVEMQPIKLSSSDVINHPTASFKLSSALQIRDPKRLIMIDQNTEENKLDPIKQLEYESIANSTNHSIINKTNISSSERFLRK